MAKTFLSFGVVGGIGFAVDAGVLMAVSALTGWHPVVARIPAVLIAIVVTYILNSRLTFQGHQKSVKKSLPQYFSANMLAQGINVCVYSAILFILPWFMRYPVAALAIGSLSAMVFSYLASKYWVFEYDKTR